MGLSLGLGGSKGSSTTTEKYNKSGTQFSQEVLDYLNSLMLQVGDQSVGQNQALAQLAMGMAGEDIDIEPIMAEARRQGSMAVGQNYQSLARQAGSDANSLVAAANSEAIANMESNLASTEAELLMAERDSNLDAISTALDASNSQYDVLLGLGELLKGGQWSEEGTSTSKTKNSSTSWNAGFKGAGK